ncbi:MAG: sulfatase family protein [Promethearchaeota archaeon]
MDKKKKPNILFIMADDHAFHAISCYTKAWNKNDKRAVINETLNIDRIGTEGARFDNCFCTNSICTPSRASILTGKYAHITGVTTLATKMPNKIPTFASIMQKNGYQTAIVGKWHLGIKKKYRPKGFDYWNILPGQGVYYNPIMIENGKVKRLKGYVTDIITDFCLKWLEKRNKDKPFVLLCHHKAPHRPWEPDEKHKDLYKNKDIPIPYTFNDDYKNRASAAAHANMRIENALNCVDLKLKCNNPVKRYLSLPIPEEIEGYTLETNDGEKVVFKSKQQLKEWKYQRYIKDYLRCIASIDDNVGRLLNYLEKEEILDDTIVIYTSDQGFFLGDHGWYDKRFMYEESLRMPFLMRYPPEIKKGTIIEDIILNVDFAETFLDFADIPIPEDMQGRSFRPLLRGEIPDDWQKSFYYRYWVNGTFHKVYAHYGIRTLKYKLIYYYCDPLKQKGARKDPHEPEWELFDLENDPYELNNIYNNPNYQDIVKNLKNELFALQKKLKDKPYKAKK